MLKKRLEQEERERYLKEKMMIMEGNDEFGENLEGKRWKIDIALRGGRRPREKDKKEGELGGFLPVLCKTPPFLCFPTTFAMLEHGLLRSSVVEAWKLPSSLNNRTLKRNLPRSSVA